MTVSTENRTDMTTVTPNDEPCKITSSIYGRAVIYASTLSRDEKAVLGVILHHMFDEKIESFPSQPRIATLSGVCLRTVIDVTVELAKRGWLQTTSEGIGRGNRYSITPVDADVRPAVLIKAVGRKASNDAIVNLAADREKKGLPATPPPMTDASTVILAALKNLPNLQCLANNNDALKLSTIVGTVEDVETGEVVSTGKVVIAEHAIYALSKLNKVIEGQVYSSASIRHKAHYFVAHEYEAPVRKAKPAAKAAHVKAVKVERSRLSAEVIAADENANADTREQGRLAVLDGATAAIDAVHQALTTNVSAPVRKPAQPMAPSLSILDLLGAEQPSQPTIVAPVFDEADAALANRQLMEFAGNDYPTMEETMPLSRRARRGEITDLIYKQDNDWAGECYMDNVVPF